MNNKKFYWDCVSNIRYKVTCYPIWILLSFKILKNIFAYQIFKNYWLPKQFETFREINYEFNIKYNIKYMYNIYIYIKKKKKRYINNCIISCIVSIIAKVEYFGYWNGILWLFRLK